MLSPLRRRRDGAYTARIRLLVAPEELDRELELFLWSAPHWTHVGVYALNRVGIGAGYRLFTMPKKTYVRRFGLAFADGSLQLLGDGQALVVMSRNDENGLVNGLAP